MNIRLLNETTVGSSVNVVNVTDVFTSDFEITVSLPFSKPFLKLQGIWSRLYKISAEVCNTLWPVQ